MSSERENTKDLSTEVSKTSVDNVDDTFSEDSQDKEVKVENDGGKASEKVEAEAKSSSDKPTEVIDKKEKKESEPKKEKSENHEESKNKDEKEKKNEKSNDSKTDNDTEEGEGSDKDDENNTNDDKKGVPLLDQPLEQSGTRERKKVQRFNEDFPVEVKEGKTDIPAGTGVQLGEIPRIDASISRFKNDDLKLLHRVLYRTPGKTALIKKNIKKFNGFDFKKDSEEYSRKLDSTKKFELKQLKIICEMLDLDKKGVKDEIAERVIDFLLEPKDSGKPVGGGRPKRTAAVRANNRGYSSHDDSYSSDERRASRGGRGKGRRTNLKDDSTTDEEFHPSDASETRPRVVKRKPSGGGRKRIDTDEDDVSEVDSVTSEDSDEEPRKRKKIKKIATNNKPKGKSTPRTRGRKPAAETDKKSALPKRGGRKRDRESSEESEEEEEAHDDDENASSSEDEPLIKKAKSPQPPTDEEIKKYVKEILDGANLEEITMKTVCKQVYAHYPDFDLAHKKDFIKSTVKSLIST